MSTTSGDRAAHFPSIEKRYGQPMRYWFARMRERADDTYPAQLAYLMEEHGFSRAHANAVVMYCRGSTSSRRHDSVADYLSKLDRTQAKTIRAIFAAAAAPGTHPPRRRRSRDTQIARQGLEAQV